MCLSGVLVIRGWHQHSVPQKSFCAPLVLMEDGVRADLSGHLKYSRRWSGVCAGVLLGAQYAEGRTEEVLRVRSYSHASMRYIYI